ncbi:MAG: hypothetical protein ACLFPA_12375 [Dichotomicrobium sp.]
MRGEVLADFNDEDLDVIEAALSYAVDRLLREQRPGVHALRVMEARWKVQAARDQSRQEADRRAARLAAQ